MQHPCCLAYIWKEQGHWQCYWFVCPLSGVGEWVGSCLGWLIFRILSCCRLILPLLIPLLSPLMLAVEGTGRLHILGWSHGSSGVGECRHISLHIRMLLIWQRRLVGYDLECADSLQGWSLLIEGIPCILSQWKSAYWQRDLSIVGFVSWAMLDIQVYTHLSYQGQYVGLVWLRESHQGLDPVPSQLLALSRGLLQMSPRRVATLMSSQEDVPLD